MSVQEICLTVDGNVVNDEISIREANIKQSSYVEAFKKPREKLVIVQFRGNMHELVVSEQCQVQHIINEILVWIS